MSRPCALYRFYGEAGKLLYVGITYNLGSRWSQHKSESSWWSQVIRNEVTWHDDRESAEVAEVEAIRGERPVYNRQHIHIPGHMRSSDVRSNFAGVTDHVTRFGRMVGVLVRGRPVAAVVPADWYHQAVAAIGEPTAPDAPAQPPTRSA